jgi:hypothetical protein
MEKITISILKLPFVDMFLKFPMGFPQFFVTPDPILQDRQLRSAPAPVVPAPEAAKAGKGVVCCWGCGPRGGAPE